MNKYTFLSIILLILPVSLSAQQFKAGVMAGISATQISGDELGGYDRGGLVAGGLVSTDLSKKFSLSMEILFFQKGSKKNPDPDREDYTIYKLRLNYFEMPLLFQWRYSKRFTFEAGPTFGALLTEKEENELGEIPWDPPRPFNKFELGIAGGLKVHFAKRFGFTSRIESSMIPVREHQSGATYRWNKGQYNAALSFTLQYIFGKKDE